MDTGQNKGSVAAEVQGWSVGGQKPTSNLASALWVEGCKPDGKPSSFGGEPIAELDQGTGRIEAQSGRTDSTSATVAVAGSSITAGRGLCDEAEQLVESVSGCEQFQTV